MPATAHAEVSQFVSYRQNKLFEELYGAGKAKVGLGESQGAAVEIDCVAYKPQS